VVLELKADLKESAQLPRLSAFQALNSQSSLSYFSSRIFYLPLLYRTEIQFRSHTCNLFKVFVIFLYFVLDE
jgi:hypothetical protein